MSGDGEESGETSGPIIQGDSLVMLGNVYLIG